MGLSPANLCAANSILPTANGLSRCRPHHLAWRNEHGFVPNGNLQGSFAYCPKGHITDVHQDSIFEGRFTTVLFGRKLFITWPPSKDNLNVYSEIHGQYTGFVLPAMMSRFKDPQVTLHSHGSVNFMPPGTIHAVLNLDSAATYAYDVLCPPQLSEVVRLVRWERRIANRLIASGDQTDTVPCINNEHREGIRLWKEQSPLFSNSEQVETMEALLSLSP
ncbi:hypothetical protein OC845_006783 [Tilletia horrida]|nr:hypothetical protein OC845_006783 [Tilletia horrida]